MDTETTISPAALAAAFNADRAHIFACCCSATETLREQEDGWHAAVVDAFEGWVADQLDGWASHADGWTAFAEAHDRMLLVAVPCGCRPKATCDKCGPVKGKVRGTVYLRRIDDDRYFLASPAG